MNQKNLDQNQIGKLSFLTPYPLHDQVQASSSNLTGLQQYDTSQGTNFERELEILRKKQSTQSSKIVTESKAKLQQAVKKAKINSSVS